MAWTSLCELDELREGAGKYVEIDGYMLAVFLHQQDVYVMDNTCPHAGRSLSGGMIEDGCAVCPWHGWSFHLKTGQLRDTPGVAVRTYKVRLLPRQDQPAMVQADLPIY
jgi:nitrite reductase (NADH) small subunit/3-phenylpropionate/trans-cinnamate dioxygenase ferredoxin subunit